MSVKVEKIGNKVNLTIEVNKESFAIGLDKAFEKEKETVQIKGFRKGKITRTMFEQKFGVQALFQEAANFCISEAYFNAIVEKKIDVVGQPSIDLKFETITVEEGFTFSALVPVKPEIELGNYTKTGIKKETVKVTAADVEAEIKKLLKDKVEVVEKDSDTLELTDISIIDFEGFLGDAPFEGGKGENFELTIGSNQFIPGFEEQLIGMKKGATKDVNVSFPKEYHAAHLAGKAVRFVVTLHDIKVSKMPKLTDEIVKSLEIEGVANEKDLKANIEGKVLSAKEQQAKDMQIDAIVEKVASESKMDIPEVMIEDEVKKFLDNTKQKADQYKMSLEMFLSVAMGGKTLEVYKEELKVEALKKVKYGLTLEAIAKKEDIKPTDEEMDNKFKELAIQYKMEEQQIRTMVRQDLLVQDLTMELTIKFLVKNA